MVLKLIKRSIAYLYDPAKGWKELKSRSFEEAVSDYMTMLLFVSLTAAVFSFIFSFAKSAFYDIFYTIDVQYLRMVNYALGRSSSLMFFYLFAGTFLVFFLSIILMPFFRKMKYVELLRVIFFSLTPILVWGWLPLSYIPLGLWSIFLFVRSVREQKENTIKRGSLKERD